MAQRSTLADSLVLSVVSLAAGAATIGGLLLTGFGVIFRGFDLGEATPIVSGGLMGVGIPMAFGGGVAAVLCRMRGSWVDLRGGWQMLLAAMLAAVPVALMRFLAPLVLFWRDVLAKASAEGVFHQSDWGLSGLVVIPFLIIFAVPAVQAFTAMVVALSSVLMLPLVALRSASLLRILYVTVVLTGGLVVAGGSGAVSFDRLMPLAEQGIQNLPDPSGTERPQAQAMLQRYHDVTRGSALTLGWAWLALLIWVPLLATVAPSRADSMATAASPPEPPGPDIASADAAERERAYQEAASQIDRSSGPAW